MPYALAKLLLHQMQMLLSVEECGMHVHSWENIPMRML